MSIVETTARIYLTNLHKAQRQVIQESGRFNVLACGRRWGKTTLGIERLIVPALQGNPVAWFAPTYKNLAEVWKQVVSIVRPVTVRISTSEKRLELTTGGIIEMWHLETDTTRGRKYTVVVIDEAAQIKGLAYAWQEVIRPTLTDYRGGAWFLSTPRGRNFFWECYERGQSKTDTAWCSWQMPTSTNPYILRDEIDDARHDLPAYVFDQEYNALFVLSAAGRVYDTWDEYENVSEAAEYQPGAGELLWAVDDGYAGELDRRTGTYTANSHPRVFLLIQIRNDGRVCVFREHTAVRRQSDEHIEDVLALDYPTPDYAVVDKSAAQLRGRLHSYGIPTRASPPRVEESIKALRSALAPDRNQWRRVLVHPRCKHLRFEMLHYTYDSNGKPNKQHDHCLDALRYAVWTLRYEVAA